jgi:lysophospholipid acyltransferase (LPLAT)-like uncharacterized protein
MELAYVDESGSVGYKQGSSATYTLGCVLVRGTVWPDAFDAFISYRRFLKREFGIPVRAELKANWLVRGSGTIEHLALSDGARFRIFRGHLRLARKMGVQAFAVSVVKARIKKQTWDPRDIAWEYLFQRLERRSTLSGQPVYLIHDEGENDLIRKLARKARRANIAGSRFGTGNLRRPARLLIEDPTPRNSAESYFIQLADMTAYAAYRRLFAPPPKRTSVCPSSMWDELGDARIVEVNELTGGHPGLVEWPRN